MVLPSEKLPLLSCSTKMLPLLLLFPSLSWLTQSQLEAMAAKSDFKSTIGTPTGRTVTLSTCSYEYNDARYVVIGALNPVD